MSKVIITGITGQDGALLSEYLINNTEHEVFGVLRRTAKPDYSNIPQYIRNDQRFKFVNGDLADAHSMNELVQSIKPDYFINFAANSFVGTSWLMPEQTFDVNTLGVIRQLEAIRKYAPTCRYYQAGSSEEFGDVKYALQDELHPLRPRSPYGASKAAARHVVKVYRESYNLFAIQGWLFNHESCERGEDFVTQKIVTNIARIARSISDGVEYEPLEVGNIDAKRDWSHAKDFVVGIWMMLNQDKHRVDFPSVDCGNIIPYLKEYVLASGETHSIREFIEKAFSELGFTGLWTGSGLEEKFLIKSEGQDFKTAVRINPKFYRPAEVELLLGDSSLARRELGWEPKYSFDGLVSEMVKCAVDRI